MDNDRSSLVAYYIEQITSTLRQKGYTFPIHFSTRYDHYQLMIFCVCVPKTFLFDDKESYLSVEYFKCVDSFNTNSFTEILGIINDCCDTREYYV